MKVVQRQSLESGEGNKGGLTIIYLTDELCENGQNFGLTVDMICLNSGDDSFTYIPSESNSCQFKAQLKSQNACYVASTNAFVKWLQNYSYYFGAFIIIVGFIIGLFGKPFFKPVLCLGVTVGVTLILALVLFSIFFNAYTADWLGWLVLAICFIVGGILGIILAKFSRFGVAILAAFGGFCLGLIIYGAFLY